ncbi:MAG: ABC transporter permease [Pseudomonadota bacterium]|uniref:ABC transporter permease n=1 Tax=Phenylobacterium sp. TaxID=1871053 RepID=UPI0025D854F3|nr:ABC transporter permease [Phenylobacterium sp.]MBT9470533.1 ABC transporter permease [Phenylobacterium sp.]
MGTAVEISTRKVLSASRPGNGLRFARAAGKRCLELVLLLVTLSTLLFFLLRASGDPAVTLAGADADAETVQAIRVAYGFDRPLFVQYLSYMSHLARGDFGLSLANSEPAMKAVLWAMPATVSLALLAMLLTVVIASPIGAWLGAAPDRPERRATAVILYILQGTPGFVVALVLIQIFAVQAGWLPAIGRSGLASWVLPTVSLSLFLAPKLARVLAANVGEAFKEDYVRTARAAGAGEGQILVRHVLPNALLGSIALVGSQFAFLLGGVVVIETIFAWPGLGRLLVQSTLSLDFPVVQAAALAVAVLVFAAGMLTDLLFLAADPRLRTQGDA